MSDYGAVVLAVVLLACNFFFVGAEFSLVAARRSQIEPMAEAGSRWAKITLRAMEQVSLMMAGAQLGITMCSLGLGAVGEPAVAHLIEPLFEHVGVPEAFVHPIAFAIALAVVVYLHVVLGEMIPKNIALAAPERAAVALGPPLMGIVFVLRPIIVALNALANASLRLLRVEPREEVSSSFTREEVAALVEESRGEGTIAPGEYDRLAGALGFTEKQVAAVLMPWDSLTTVPRGATVAEVEDICAATGYSRFPVAEAAQDGGEVVGYLHIKDVLEVSEERRSRVVDDKWIRPFAGVRSSDLLHDALEMLQRKGAHMAVVVDDAGERIGLATLEDVIEELVGVIRDAAHADDA